MKSLLTSLIVLGILSSTYGQANRGAPPMPGGRAVIIPHASIYIPPIVYQLHDGVAQLTDGTLLRGRFLYNKSHVFIYYANGHDDGQHIPFYKFERLTLAGADTSVLPRSDSTVFVRIRNQLYRRLTIGKVGLYDKTYAVNEDKGNVGNDLFTWSEDGKLKRLYKLEQINQWFYATCQQNNWTPPDVFRSKVEIIKQLAKFDPTP